MIKQVSDLKSTKDKIQSYLQQPVKVKVNLGRNKFVSFVGTVSNAYPALFTVTPNEEYKGKTSFSYGEYMCGIVDLKKINE